MSKATVLILTEATDAHAQPVQVALRRHGVQVVRAALSSLPGQLALTAWLGKRDEPRSPASSPCWEGTLWLEGEPLALAELRSLWWRRPGRIQAPAAYPAPIARVIERETRRGLLGLLYSQTGWAASPPALWVSPPEAIERAEYKPLQLATAQAVGLRVPRTLLTTDPAAVQTFFEACEGQVVCKALARGVVEWPEGSAAYLYTSAVQASDLAALGGVQVMPHLLQERLPAACALRVVVIGRQLFAVEIHPPATEPAVLDWRRAYSQLRYELHSLPKQVQTQLLKLTQLLGLQFSSLDLLLTPEGEYVYLEQNPNGQWYWLEERLGARLPLAEAMARLLAHPEEEAL
ncbi:hypothetical protein [Thermogemmatispora carboxidivorans]|uniref:hypothetical protein n=1 Tax=Thermogemmatispora carboxidivorans TaxID=1382306 RepID=UPI00069C87EC|nr:hypothetical protein [Thermogemmatispora carboxidivorans]